MANGKKNEGRFQAMKNKGPTRMGFEPTRAEHIGLAVQRLNHSATSSTLKGCHVWKVCVIPLLFE